MPKEHRNLLNDLDEWSENNRGNFTRQDNLVQLSEEIIREVHAFRDKHLEYARSIYMNNLYLTKITQMLLEREERLS